MKPFRLLPPIVMAGHFRLIQEAVSLKPGVIEALAGVRLKFPPHSRGGLIEAFAATSVAPPPAKFPPHSRGGLIEAVLVWHTALLPG